ncbi:hypothetical protein WH91_02235 [Devosia psychrophila]|nr:hypothetical protein WH91_02235 [Devosia psychrophila]
MPFLHLGPGVVKFDEPARVQELGPVLAIERLDEGIVGGLSKSAEVQDDALLMGPEVKVLEMNSEPQSPRLDWG